MEHGLLELSITELRGELSATKMMKQDATHRAEVIVTRTPPLIREPEARERTYLNTSESLVCRQVYERELNEARLELEAPS